VTLRIILEFKEVRASLEFCPAEFVHQFKLSSNALIRMQVKSHLWDWEHTFSIFDQEEHIGLLNLALSQILSLLLHADEAYILS
jgi:hypothetical protein